MLFLFWWRHFRFWEISIFLNFRGSRCPDFSSKTMKAKKLKFCVHVEKVWLSAWFHFHFYFILWLKRRRNSPGPENRRKNFDKILNILIHNFLLENIFWTHIEQKLFSLLRSIDWFEKIGSRALRLAWRVKFLLIPISFYW